MRLEVYWCVLSFIASAIHIIFSSQRPSDTDTIRESVSDYSKRLLVELQQQVEE